jgi:hypothetical protein
MTTSHAVRTAALAAVLAAGCGLGGVARADGDEATRESRARAVDTFLDRCVPDADLDDQERGEIFWNQLFSMGYSSGHILEATQAIGDDCKFISIKAAVMQLAGDLGIERGERPATPPPPLTSREEFEARPPRVEAQQPSDEVAQDVLEGEAAEPIAEPEEPAVPVESPKVYATPIDQFLELCLDSPSDGDRALAEIQQEQLLAMGYGVDRIVELFRQLPEDCTYISYKTAVTNLGRVQDERDRARRAAAEARAAERAPRERNAGVVDRLLGFTMNLGFGGGRYGTYNYTRSADFASSHFDVELPGFELRIFPIPGFSIDLLWQLGDAAWRKSKLSSDSFAMTVFFHIHTPPASVGDRMNIGFAAAPYLGFTIEDGETIEIQGMVLGGDSIGVGTGARVGVDLFSDEGIFGLGAYLRPGFFATAGPFGDAVKSYEMLLEINVGLYVPRPDL